MIKHNKDKQENLESGQVIVIMAFVIIVLVGMLGLAIDGGGLFFLWRDAQNATDAAVLNAAYAQCLDGDETAVINAGETAAEYNGFDNNTVDNWVTIDVDTSTQLITATIRATKPAYFIQVLGFPKQLEITNQATAFCIPKFDPATVPAMYITGDCTVGINWSGSGGTFIGGAFAPRIKFTAKTKLSGGDLLWMSEFDKEDFLDSQDGSWHKSVSEKPAENLNIDLDVYKPGGSVWTRIKDAGGIAKYVTNAVDPVTGLPLGDMPESSWISPSGTWKPANTELHGLYYVDVDVDVPNSVTTHNEGASIITTGELQFSGKEGQPYFYYGHNDATGQKSANAVFLGSLKESTNCGTNVVKFSGNNSNVKGIFWAPNGGVDLAGSKLTVVGAVVADKVDMSASDLYFEWDPELIPPRPPKTGFAG